MKLTFIEPGSAKEGFLEDVQQTPRKGFTFLEFFWDVEGQQIKSSYFMTDVEKIKTDLAKLGLDLNQDTDEWLGTPAKLLIESNNGYLQATILGKAETLKAGSGSINFAATPGDDDMPF